MFCCGKKKQKSFSKSQINPDPDHPHARSASASHLFDYPNLSKSEMFSRQSPHFSQIEITKKHKFQAVDFDEKTQLHCQFCGGKSCKHENWTRCVNPAIKGLHSNWINEDVIASQRLSDRLIEEYKIIDQFKEKGVKAIFNLQEPGEHPYCGDGIKMRSGFSYTPELLMNNGISFFNFFWKDLTNPTFERCLNCAQVMDFIIRNGGKLLVHCHAGQGRTALVIGAYLIISGRAKDDKEAIAQTRKNRPKCFSKSYNQKYIKAFYEKFMEIKQIFPTVSQKISLKEVLNRQSLLFHGEERKYTKFIPKVIYLVLNKIKSLNLGNLNIEDIKIQMGSITQKQLLQVDEIRKKINQGDWSVITNMSNDIYILLHVVIEFIKSLSNFIIESQHIEKIQQNFKKLDSQILGFLTSIAELAEILSQKGTLAQVDEIYSKFSEIIIQNQFQYHSSIQNVLKQLSVKKNEIYQQEEIKEALDVSPIKQQVENSKLKQQTTNNFTQKSDLITVNNIDNEVKNNYGLNQQDGNSLNGPSQGLQNNQQLGIGSLNQDYMHGFSRDNLMAADITLSQSLPPLFDLTKPQKAQQIKMFKDELYDANVNSQVFPNIQNKVDDNINHINGPTTASQENLNASDLKQYEDFKPQNQHKLNINDVQSGFDEDHQNNQKTLKSTQNDFLHDILPDDFKSKSRADVTPIGLGKYNSNHIQNDDQDDNDGPEEEIKESHTPYSDDKTNSNFKNRSDAKTQGFLINSHDHISSTAGPSQNGSNQTNIQSQQLPPLISKDVFNIIE